MSTHPLDYKFTVCVNLDMLIRIYLNILKFGVKAVYCISPREAYRAGRDQYNSPIGNCEETELAGVFWGGGA